MEESCSTKPCCGFVGTGESVGNMGDSKSSNAELLDRATAILAQLQELSSNQNQVDLMDQLDHLLTAMRSSSEGEKKPQAHAVAPTLKAIKPEPKKTKKEIIEEIRNGILDSLQAIFDEICDTANPSQKPGEEMLRVVLIQLDNGMTPAAVEDLLSRDPDNPRDLLGNLALISRSFDQDLYILRQSLDQNVAESNRLNRMHVREARDEARELQERIVSMRKQVKDMTSFCIMLRAEQTRLSELISGRYPQRSIFMDIGEAYGKKRCFERKRRLFDVLLSKLQKFNDHHAKLRNSPYIQGLSDEALKAKYLAMFAPFTKTNKELEQMAGMEIKRAKQKAAYRGIFDPVSGKVIAQDKILFDSIEITGHAHFFHMHRSTRHRNCGFAYPADIEALNAEDLDELIHRFKGRLTMLMYVENFGIPLMRDVAEDMDLPRNPADRERMHQKQFSNFPWLSGRVPAGKCICGQWVYLLNPRFLAFADRLHVGLAEAHRKEVMQLYYAAMRARYAADGISVVYSCINRYCPNASTDIIDAQVIAEVEAREAKVPFNGLRGLRQCTHPECMVEWCGICGTSRYHTGPCPGPSKLAADLQELFDTGMVRICPSCKQPCYKDQGECNSVTCKCGKAFCWRCGGDLNPMADHHHTCNEAIVGTEITDYGRYGFTNDTAANTRDPRHPNARSLEEAEMSMKQVLGIEDDETKEEALDSPEPEPLGDNPPDAPAINRYGPRRNFWEERVAEAMRDMPPIQLFQDDDEFPPLA